MFIRFSTRIHMSNVSLSLSTHASIVLSLLLSILVLAVIRAALLFLRSRSSSTSQKQAIAVQHQHQQPQPKDVQHHSSTSSWRWGVLPWENLPTLPISLKVNENNMKGKGVGLVEPHKSVTQPWQPGSRRSGPTFEPPLPAMYQTDVPVSMAKMIMSRHTFRKPTQRPPPRLRAGSQMQITRRPASMV